MKRVEGNLTDPRSLLNKATQAIKFQEQHDKKYIAHLEKKCSGLQSEKEELKLKCVDYEDQLVARTEFDSAPSDITASKFGGFAERRVPMGHPSSNGKSNIMASAFTNKLSESSYGGNNRLTTVSTKDTYTSRPYSMH